MRTSLYVAAEALLGVEDLKQWIREHNEAGSSFDDIAKEMYSLTDGKVSVSLYTVRRWADQESVA